MANQALIDIAGEVAQSKGFNPGWKDAADNIQKWADKAEAQLKERKTERDKSDAKVADYMDKIPEGGGIEKIPEHAREDVANFLSAGRDEYAKHANALRDLDPRDKEYQNHVQSMNKITQNFANLDKQFTTLFDNKAEYLEDSDGRNISYGTKGSDLRKLSEIYTDETKIKISPEGNLAFQDLATLGSESYTNMGDLPKYVEKNVKGQKSLAMLSNNIEKAGKEITNEANLRRQLEAIVDAEGRNGLVSLAADDLVNEADPKGLGISDELLFDPERTDELREIVINTYLESFKAIGKASAAAKNDLAQTKRQERLADRKVADPKNELDTLWVIPVDPEKQE